MLEHASLNLDRRFQSLSPGEPADNEVLALRASLGDGPAGEDWETVLGNIVSVIRAGAGSGKTTELRQQVARLKGIGEPAFFVRLEHLTKMSLQDAVASDQQNRTADFSRWKRRGGKVRFFLDALDEARLPRGQNGLVLDQAISSFLAGVKRYGKDVSVVLSTRSSEWHERSDRPKMTDLVRRLKSLEPDDAIPENALGVYGLLPLTSSQIARLAKSNDIDGGAFCAALINAKIESIAQTPLEIEMLVDIWRDNVNAGRDGAAGFTNRLEVFRRAVEHKLRPTADGERRSNLGYATALEGVKALAAMCALTGLRDFSLFEQGDEVIDPRPALAAVNPDWNDPSVRQLLSYGFFSPESGGRVRFNHREIQDYLAATFFDDAIRRLGGNTKPVDGLIARFGATTHIPSDLFNFFGWLGTLNPSARRLVIGMQPSLLMETGDPAIFSSDERKAILFSHARQYENRNRRGEWFHDTDLSVFASPELAETVAQLIDETPSDEFRGNLIDLARVGNMRALSQQLCDIACNPFVDLRLRTEACEALVKFASRDQRRQVCDCALGHIAIAAEIEADVAPEWNGFIVSAARVYAPETTDLEDVRPFLDAMARERRNHSTSTHRAVSALAIEFEHPSEDWLAFLVGLIRGTRDENHHRLLRARPEKRPLLRTMAECLLKRLREADVEPSEAVLDAIELCCGANYRDGGFAFSSILEKIPEALQPVTNIKIAMIRRRWMLLPDDRPFLGAYRIVDGLAMRERGGAKSIWSPADIDALVDLAGDTTSHHERQMLIGAAGEALRRLEEFSDRKAALNRVQAFARKSGDAEMRRRYLPRRLASLHRLHFWFVHQGGLSKLRRQTIRAFTDPIYKTKRTFDFWRHREKVRSGEARAFLANNAHSQPEGTQNGTLETHLEHLRSEFGPRIARDMEMGYVSLWKRYPAPSIEGESEHWSIAEAAARGIESEIAGRRLDTSEAGARRSFAIGFHVLNSVPEWIEHFLPDHADLLAEMLRTPARMALDARSHPQKIPAEPIYRLRYAPQSVRRVAAPVLAEAVVDNPLCHVENLEAALSVIAHAEQEGLIEEAWAGGQFRTAAASGDWDRAWTWMVYLFRTDAPFAWEVTKPWIEKVWPPGEASPMIGFMARYRDMADRASEGRRQDSLSSTPMVLLNMSLLGLETALPENDPWHEDTYSPDMRDKASEQRRYWFEQLAETGDKDVQKALEEAAKSQQYVGRRDTLRYHADRLAKNAAQPNLLVSTDLAQFLASFGAPPRTREDFSRFVVSLVEALLDQFANSNHDEARPYRRRAGAANERDENDLRNWLSARIAESADTILTVTRESEAAEENRTDILVTARRQGLGCVVIEVKLADRDHWSGDVLVSTLETQVSQKYLREDDKHAGVLVLVNTLGPALQKTVAGTRQDFNQITNSCSAAVRAITDAKSYFIVALEL